jgi:hypothetical protein
MYNRNQLNKVIQEAADSVISKQQLNTLINKPKMTTNDLQSYVKEIETQRNKPISEQINDLTIAGAELLRALDNYIKEVNTK